MDAYDLSATDSQYAIVAYEFDIGNGNTAGIPSVNSPCQVWGASGNQTITGTEAHSVLSKTNGTYYADTHVNTTIGFVVADTETNDASFADGPNYQIGVGSLDYTCASLFGSTTYTIDVANVGIVEGTDVSGELQIGGTSGPTATFDMTFPSVAPTPEPSTLALMATGLAGLAAYAWRKRRRKGFSARPPLQPCPSRRTGCRRRSTAAWPGCATACRS